MTTYTIYAASNDFAVYSTSNTFSSARSGAGLSDTSGDTNIGAGHEYYSPTYYCWEGFFSFDCSAIPAGTDSNLALKFNVASNGGSNVLELREHAWASPGTSAWVAGASLSGKTLFGTSASISSTGAKTLSASSYTLSRAVNKYLIHDQRLRTDTPATAGDYLNISASETSGTSNDPYLTIDVIPSSISGTLTKTLSALTSTSAGAVSIKGQSTTTLGALTSAATGALPITGTGSPALAALTSTAAGVLPLAGGGSPTLGALTTASAGALAIAGALTATLSALTGTLQGDLADGAGSLVQTLGALTGTATGLLTVEGTAGPTLGVLTSSGAGALPVVGGTSATLDPLTATAEAELILAGLVGANLAPLTGTGAAALVIVASGDGNLGVLTLTAAGQQFVFAITPAGRTASADGGMPGGRRAEAH